MIEDEEEEGTNKRKSFVLKVNEDLQIASVAGLGLLCPWNTGTIEDHLMTYLNNEGKYVKAGACLGIGICTAGVYDENDIAFALLSDSVNDNSAS